MKTFEQMRRSVVRTTTDESRTGMEMLLFLRREREGNQLAARPARRAKYGCVRSI